jgi:transcriptional regulator with XRE-family HTH domain
MFGDVLRQWRRKRDLSQLDLAAAARISQRHLSFIESGRSQPSREIILRIAQTLDLPLRARNELLLAAGYAPHYPERHLDDAAMGVAKQALRRILDHHEPFPAVVLDRYWNIVMSNRATSALLAAALDRIDPNFLRNILSLRPRIRSWMQTGAALHARLRREALADPGSPSQELLEELGAQFPEPPLDDAPLEPVIPLRIEIEGQELSLFNTLTTFGTPQDVTLQELRVEMSFPADDRTERALRLLADAV